MHTQYNWPLIGHQPIKDYFAKTFNAGRINHAYLFEGPEHVGKMTFARLLSKTLLCEGERTIPCVDCRACRAFDHGAHPDVGVLKRGEEPSIKIEPTRDFIATLAQTPLLGRWKIGMIEDAADFSRDAAHAPLKIIEEPPPRAVIFITAAAPVPSTISSRCQNIRFGLVSGKDIADFLGGRGIPASMAEEISKLACGRPGQAVQLCDEANYKQRRQQLEELRRVVASDEKARMLWIAETFGGKANLQQKREDCGQAIHLMQYILRSNLSDKLENAYLLRRTISAGQYLKANIDPRLVMESILLNYNP